jgi:hypothetical protein
MDGDVWNAYSTQVGKVFSDGEIWDASATRVGKVWGASTIHAGGAALLLLLDQR